MDFAGQRKKSELLHSMQVSHTMAKGKISITPIYTETELLDSWANR